MLSFDQRAAINFTLCNILGFARKIRSSNISSRACPAAYGISKATTGRKPPICWTRDRFEFLLLCCGELCEQSIACDSHSGVGWGLAGPRSSQPGQLGPPTSRATTVGRGGTQYVTDGCQCKHPPGHVSHRAYLDAGGGLSCGRPPLHCCHRRRCSGMWCRRRRRYFTSRCTQVPFACRGGLVAPPRGLQLAAASPRHGAFVNRCTTYDPPRSQHNGVEGCISQQRTNYFPSNPYSVGSGSASAATGGAAGRIHRTAAGRVCICSYHQWR